VFAENRLLIFGDDAQIRLVTWSTSLSDDTKGSQSIPVAVNDYAVESLSGREVPSKSTPRSWFCNDPAMAHDFVVQIARFQLARCRSMEVPPLEIVKRAPIEVEFSGFHHEPVQKRAHLAWMAPMRRR